jgi:hypothetical protein
VGKLPTLSENLYFVFALRHISPSGAHLGAPQAYLGAAARINKSVRKTDEQAACQAKHLTDRKSDRKSLIRHRNMTD